MPVCVCVIFIWEINKWQQLVTHFQLCDLPRNCKKPNKLALWGHSQDMCMWQDNDEESANARQRARPIGRVVWSSIWQTLCPATGYSRCVYAGQCELASWSTCGTLVRPRSSAILISFSCVMETWQLSKLAQENEIKCYIA